MAGDAYTDFGLVLPEMDIENLMENSVESRFKAGASYEEGCNGQMGIDTSFENTSQPNLDLVSSDLTRYEDLPAPRDVARGKYPHREY